ncbi:MAG: hypothetical protein ACRER2_00760 [Methylococcales bacterium]
MNINLYIERLVLDGVDIAAGHSHLLQTNVKSEMARLLTENGLSPSLAQGIALPRIAASKIRLNDINNPTQLGHQIAQSVYGEIGRE